MREPLIPVKVSVLLELIKAHDDWVGSLPPEEMPEYLARHAKLKHKALNRLGEYQHATGAENPLLRLRLVKVDAKRWGLEPADGIGYWGPVTIDAGAASQEVFCNDCDNAWADTYTLTGWSPAY